MSALYRHNPRGGGRMSKLLTGNFFATSDSPLGENPEDKKQIILNNVYCGQCRSGVTIINASGFTEGSSLVLQGFCGVCGGNVARVIEELD